MLMVAKYLSEEQGFTIPVECSMCGKEVNDASEMSPEGFLGAVFKISNRR